MAAHRLNERNTPATLGIERLHNAIDSMNIYSIVLVMNAAVHGVGKVLLSSGGGDEVSARRERERVRREERIRPGLMGSRHVSVGVPILARTAHLSWI